MVEVLTKAEAIPGRQKHIQSKVCFLVKNCLADLAAVVQAEVLTQAAVAQVAEVLTQAAVAQVAEVLTQTAVAQVAEVLTQAAVVERAAQQLAAHVVRLFFFLVAEAHSQVTCLSIYCPFFVIAIFDISSVGKNECAVYGLKYFIAIFTAVICSIFLFVCPRNS